LVTTALPQNLNRADDGETIAGAHVVAAPDAAERTLNA
jgi:hypothetical protein